MRDTVIVSRAAREHYINLQRRTVRACAEFAPEAAIDFAGIAGYVWDYGYKIDAINQARRNGWRVVLWMDVTFQPIAPLDLLWAHIQEYGWFVPLQSSSMLGTWASDDALVVYGIDRDEAMSIPLCFSGIVGLDFGNAVAVEIFEAWERLRPTFDGAHYNRPGEELEELGNKFTGHVSYDSRVEGHRHDEAALSFVLASKGLRPVVSSFLSIDNPENFTIARNVVRIDGTYAD